MAENNGRQRNVRLARVVTTDNNRLRQINRYVDPDTAVEIVEG